MARSPLACSIAYGLSVLPQSEHSERAIRHRVNAVREPLFLQGIEEFNHGCFFAAHEVWEELWNETVGEEKRFYQGLIQVAAGYYKLSVAEYNGARKLLERGRQIIAEFPAGYGGVDLAPLLMSVATTVHDLVAGQASADFHTPTIRLLE